MSFVIKTGQSVLPLPSPRALLQHAAEGRLQPTDLVRALPDGDWRRAADHPSLAGAWPHDPDDADALAIDDTPTSVERVVVLPAPPPPPSPRPTAAGARARWPRVTPAQAAAALAVLSVAAAMLLGGLMASVVLGGEPEAARSGLLGARDGGSAGPARRGAEAPPPAVELGAIADGLYEVERARVAAARDVACEAQRGTLQRFVAGYPYVVVRRAGGGCHIASQAAASGSQAELESDGVDCATLARELETRVAERAAVLEAQVASACDAPPPPAQLELAAREAALAALVPTAHAVRQGMLDPDVEHCFTTALTEARSLHQTLHALRCGAAGACEPSSAATEAAAVETAAALCRVDRGS